MLRLRKYQLGVSLIELMISILIASLVLTGVIGVVSTSRQSFVNEQESSIMQENARFAISLVTRDIRMAGGLGCTPKTGVWGGVAIEDATGLSGVAGIHGFDAEPSWAYQADDISDALIIRYADPAHSIPIKTHTGSGSSSTFSLHSDSRFAKGDKLVIVDSSCRHFAIFDADANTGSKSVGHTSTGTCQTALFSNREDFDCDTPSSSDAKYRPGSTIYPFRVSGYFVGESEITPGVPALKRQIFSDSSATGQRSEELAQGIEYLNFLYGIDSDPGDGYLEVDTFVEASVVPDWGQVLAVRMTLVLRSQFEFFDEDTTFAYGDFSKTDRYLRKSISSTVTIRARAGT